MSDKSAEVGRVPVSRTEKNKTGLFARCRTAPRCVFSIFKITRCSSVRSYIPRCGSVRFGRIENPTARFGAVWKSWKAHGAVRCGFQKSGILQCGFPKSGIPRCRSVRFSDIAKPMVRFGAVLYWTAVATVRSLPLPVGKTEHHRLFSTVNRMNKPRFRTVLASSFGAPTKPLFLYGYRVNKPYKPAGSYDLLTRGEFFLLCTQSQRHQQ